MASSSKATRECTRAPKCSILLSNVLGISLSPSSLDVADQNDTTNDPNKPQQYTGKGLFDSFIEENKSTLHTRLNESLSEIRLAGWIQPFTLLIKGPLEELEVIKEAWRRRFLRSPNQFTIREIGTIKSVDTEVVPQAPFLPLTKAVYEAIAALNKNNLPSGQQNVFEYLAHTYQYVHVPKPNVIRDSLGILFKEGKVYLSGNDYFVLVDTQSDMSGDSKKEKKPNSAKEKAQEKPPNCVVCESINHKSNSAHAQNVRKGTEHAHLCDKHKRGEKKANKKPSSSKDSNSLDTSREYRDLKSDKKERKNNTNPSSGNNSKKMNEKTPKKTVWGQIASFIKGKHGPPTETTPEHKAGVNKSDEIDETTKPVASNTQKPEARVDNAPKLENKTQGKKKGLDSSIEHQMENASQVQRSNSFVAQNKKRPNLVRSNTFAPGSTKASRPVDYDIIRTRIQEEKPATIKTDSLPARPTSRDHPQKSSLAQKAFYLNTSDLVRQSTPVREDEEKALFRNQRLSHNLDTFRERDGASGVKGAEKASPLQANVESSKERNSTCAVGIVRPWNTHAQSTRMDSRPLSRTYSLKETRKFSLPSTSTPTSDVNRPVLRENRDIKRSVSLRENRKSDCTPLTFQRNTGSVNRDSFMSDSPLKHLLTKNTGNTLPVSPSHPNYIPAPATQVRSRISTPNRNSFPSTSNSLKRNSWRESSLKELDGNHDYVPSKGTGFVFQDNKKRHDDVFSIDYMNPNHWSKRAIPCDCSDAGYSENYERRSVSSDAYQKTLSSVHKDEHSSIYSNSDNGILLDVISSSGSSEIQSIMNQDKKLEKKQLSPYAVAKGEVVLDSSLTFIGII